ncbi:C40 family peptidase [Lachnoclostridium sp. Marseille-P6806]|uniref:C40 family peptidase n=1 Tax=Lachnoclostridium sp. Marseille-P6806 TaxID=2364793 RepID=UPI0013EF0028|nr:C40 family peptidase [Lachnoclostridium sp. Marseille-P6806]
MERLFGKKLNRRLLALLLTVMCAVFPAVPVRAVTSSEIRQQQNATKSKLNSANSALSSLEGKQEEISDEMETAQSEIAQNMASIQMLQDQIADTEGQIEIKQQEYDEAKAREEEQYAMMKKRIQFMYERGNASYVALLMKASSFSDMLNKTEYVNQLYEYDRRLLVQYQETRKEVADDKRALEETKAELEEAESGLQEEKAALESRVSDLQSKYNNYEALISAAQAEASSLRRQYEEQTRQLSAQVEAEARAAEEARRKAEEEAAAKAAAAGNAGTENAASGDSSSQTSGTSESTAPVKKTYQAAGSATGQNVVNFACQFVGNPYVYGGTSLTNGTDCSGFTQSVYSAFGISIPRTAESQRNAGVEVASLEEAQPGDLICYPGHVGLYIGNGTIVHASTRATGIKYSAATYRSILGIRRILN